MNIQLRKGVLELCVLSMLYRKDCYGYEMYKKISESINIAEGSIYPLLHRLKKEGYFDTYMEESSDGPERKYYHLTQKGSDRRALLYNEWNRLEDGLKQIIEGESDDA